MNDKRMLNYQNIRSIDRYTSKLVLSNTKKDWEVYLDAAGLGAKFEQWKLIANTSCYMQTIRRTPL